MARSLRTLASAQLLFLACATLSAQDTTATPDLLTQQRLRSRVGAFGNFGFDFSSANFNGSPLAPNCMALDTASFTGGTGTGFGVGLLFEYPFNSMLRLNVRAGYYRMGTLQTSDAQIGPVVLKDGSSAAGVSEYSFTSTLGLVAGEITIGWRPVAKIPLTLKLGPEFGTYIQEDFTQQEQLISPSSATFIGPGGENTRIRNATTGTLGNVGLRIAGVIGADYELPLNRAETWLLAPEVGFSYGVTKVASDLDWHEHQLRGGAAVKYSFAVPPPPEAPPPPPAAPAPA
ncbi:MAG: hypothetical protein ABI876_08505, partial [Bacteroidota bacterium]